jgi:hypothetical protein
LKTPTQQPIYRPQPATSQTWWRLLIVLPDGILSNSGDKYIREYLMGLKDEKTAILWRKAVVKAVSRCLHRLCH